MLPFRCRRAGEASSLSRFHFRGLFLQHPAASIIHCGMTTSAAISSELPARSSLPGYVLYLLRSEALAIAVPQWFCMRARGASWWLFAALWLAPDLSMLGYLAGPDLGARIYNSIHAYATPPLWWYARCCSERTSSFRSADLGKSHFRWTGCSGIGLKYWSGFAMDPTGQNRQAGLLCRRSGCAAVDCGIRARTTSESPKLIRMTRNMSAAL